MVKQDYDSYTAEDHEVWGWLYREQMQNLPKLAASAYLHGVETVRFVPDRVPRFSVINEALAAVTGWSVYVVPGLIANKPFFEHLSKKEFPATTWLRKKSQLNYLPEPDMFHDVFGHVPLLSEPFFCDYLNGLSKIALEYIESETAIELIARIYWYTVEFGLIWEDGGLKIYGAGILSSPGESLFCVSDQATHVGFDPAVVFQTPYIKDKYQAQYFVIDSYKQLFDSLPMIHDTIQHHVENGIFVEASPD